MLTAEQLAVIKEIAFRKSLPINSIITIALHKWYDANKDKLENNNSTSITHVNLRLDEETEKILNFFIHSQVLDLGNDLVKFIKD